MKSALVVVALALVASACDDEKESPKVAARKAECRQLEAHVFQISPESAPQFAGLSAAEAQQLADQMVARLPREDIEQCAIGAPEVTSCMQTARDVAGLKACILPDSVLECLGKADEDLEARKVCFIVSCMEAAPSLAAVKACFDPVLDCLGKAKQDLAARKACFSAPPAAAK